MDNNNKLSEELLKSDGIDPANIPDSEHAMFEQLLNKHLNSKQPKTVIGRIFMLSKVKFKVAALIGCIIIVSAAAAITIPGVYNTIKNFITAIDEKDITEIIELSDPTSAIPQQVDDIYQIAAESKIKLVSLYTDTDDAIAFTTEVKVIDTVYDEGYMQGFLVITLVRKDNVWLVNDIDLENDETVKTELERFLEYHPNATELKLK